MKRLLSISLCSGLLTLAKMASGFVISKVVAVYGGPSGLALLGQFQSLVLAINTAVASPVSNGLVRYTAENHRTGIDACAPWWKAATRWSVILLVATAVICLAGARPLAGWLLNDADLDWLVVLAIVALPFSALFTLVIGVLNGQQQYKPYFLFSAIGVFASTVIMLALIFMASMQGALAAAALGSAFSGIFVLLWVRKEPWFKWRYWWGSMEPARMKGIGKYVLMGLSSAIFMPIALILVRRILVSEVGWDQTGQWQAVYKISEVYLSVITIAVSTYYLPRLASLSGALEIRKEIFSTAKIIMPLAMAAACAVFFSRDVIIGLLFTEEFRGARDLFAVQLIGDIFKVMGWLLGYTMWSRGAATWFIASEGAFCIVFVSTAWLLTNVYGVEGATIAYASSYIMYFFLMAVRLKYGRV